MNATWGEEIDGVRACAASVWKSLSWLCAASLDQGQTNHFNGGKPLGRIGGRIAQRRQLAHGHQNLNVMLCKAQQFHRRHDIKAYRQTFGRPGCPKTPRATELRRRCTPPSCRSIPAARFRHSAELNGATKAALNSPLKELNVEI
jgi:hypothetical protein